MGKLEKKSPKAPNYNMITLRTWPAPPRTCPDCGEALKGVNSYDDPHTGPCGVISSYTTYEEWECAKCGVIWQFPIRSWRWEDDS